jgi:hypothetical protein
MEIRELLREMGTSLAENPEGDMVLRPIEELRARFK